MRVAVAIRALLLVLAVQAGCAHYTVNRPLEPSEVAADGRPTTVSFERSDELLLVLAFSGGGKRASSLSFGVLEALRDTTVDSSVGERRLLDEVDVISAVSGGSFTAADYGLRRDRMFDDYDVRFLKRSQRQDALFRLMAPWNWIRLASPGFERSDLTAEYYDNILFDGATYADLWASGGPQIQIQATDITEGTRFTFDREQFELICSDLSSYPVARAVAASAAFPVMFSPLTLRNYGASCGVPEPVWVTDTLATRDVTSRGFHMAKHARAYRDSEAKKYVHLLDGGISDNLGLRGPLNDLLLRYGPDSSVRHGDLSKTLRVAFVIVNAQNRTRKEFGLFSVAPATGQIVDAVASMMINRYNFETVDHLRQSLELWSRDAANLRGSHVEFYIIEVSFDALANPAERHMLASVPTTMWLPAHHVDHLRDAGRRLLFSSPEYRRLVVDLGGDVPLPSRRFDYADPGPEPLSERSRRRQGRPVR